MGIQGRLKETKVSVDGTEQSPAVVTRSIKAAEYVRMSTEHQQYSTENQSDAIRLYAQHRGMAIARTYSDAGKSGLRLDGRDALKQLISDVENGTADFEAILVYDVSRWGRFQDADESAYYEYICKRASIAVHYCAEQFENDGSPVSTIVKSVKRAMAGEYSRELSAKVFAGQCRLIELGYRQGGLAGFGLRRMLQDQSGIPKGELKQGEHKSIQTDRVVLMPGPPEEVATVRLIYRMFVEEQKPEAQIAAFLNSIQVKTDLGRQWTPGTVHQILTNDKYAGDNVYNRMSFKLKRRRIHNPPDMWIRRTGAFTGIIERAVFQQAQEIVEARQRRYSEEEMLVLLHNLWQKSGVLSGLLIDETEGMPSSAAYRFRFKTLVRAYELIGYTPDRDYKYIEINRQLRTAYRYVLSDVKTKLETVGAIVSTDQNTDLLTINSEFSASVIVSRCRKTGAGSHRWLIRLDAGLVPDLNIVVRMTNNNETPLDYYLLPSIDLAVFRLRLAESNPLDIDAYRFDSLDILLRLVERVRIKEEV
jgi:DNA invertase Pin-like site-specific DNA recombinase